VEKAEFYDWGRIHRSTIGMGFGTLTASPGTLGLLEDGQSVLEVGTIAETAFMPCRCLLNFEFVRLSSRWRDHGHHLDLRILIYISRIYLFCYHTVPLLRFSPPVRRSYSNNFLLSKLSLKPAELRCGKGATRSIFFAWTSSTEPPGCVFLCFSTIVPGSSQLNEKKYLSIVFFLLFSFSQLFRIIFLPSVYCFYPLPFDDLSLSHSSTKMDPLWIFTPEQKNKIK